MADVIDNKPITLMRLPQVMARTGVTRSQLYRLVWEKQFPQPVKIGGRAIAWPDNEIDKWIEERMVERNWLG